MIRCGARTQHLSQCSLIRSVPPIAMTLVRRAPFVAYRVTHPIKGRVMIRPEVDAACPTLQRSAELKHTGSRANHFNTTTHSMDAASATLVTYTERISLAALTVSAAGLCHAVIHFSPQLLDVYCSVQRRASYKPSKRVIQSLAQVRSPSTWYGM